MAADNLLRNWALWVDGRGKAGNIKEFVPPVIAIEKADFKSGDMDSSIPVDVGLEPLETSFVLFGVDPSMFSVLGLVQGQRRGISARSFYRDLAGSEWELVEQMRGLIYSAERDALGTSGQADNGTKYMMGLEYYKVTRGDQVLVEIDVINRVRNLGGNDVLKGIHNLLAGA